jgi:putative YhdH/YhfP family quinone oxidoreductase
MINMNATFKALVVRQSDDKNFIRSIEQRNIDDLPEGDVLIRVHYSSLNYKDGLSCSGNRTVTRHYPHTPGIDAAGIVEFSCVDDFKVGDSVVVISYDLGANTSGGFGQFIRVPADWVMPLPKGLDLRESMIYGTAGYTAGLAVSLLQNQDIIPKSGPIIVTGANGGVGSVSVALLAGLGYSVSASSGKSSAEVFLKKLGAFEIIGRKAVDDESRRALLKEVWAGAIDTVGGNTLATILKSTKLRGAVVSVGLVSSSSLETTVFPFILRGISLQGTGASETTMPKRKEIWSKLANEWKPKNLEYLAVDCSLEQLNSEIDKILIGNQKGRVVVDMRN